MGNIEWFLHPCANYLFISQHQMHELITSSVSVPCLPTVNSLSKRFKNTQAVCLKKSIILICTGSL